MNEKQEIGKMKKIALTVSIRFGGALLTVRSAPPATTVANDLVTLASKSSRSPKHTSEKACL